VSALSPGPPEGPPDHVARLHTRWSDADANGVLNNAVYLTLFEEARRDFCEARRLFERQDVFPFLLVAASVEFRRPGRGGVPVEVDLTTVAIGTSSFRQRYRVRPAGEEEPWATGESTLVCVDAASGRSRPLDAGFRRALEGR